MKTIIISLLVLASLSHIALAGYSTQRSTRYITGSVQTPYSSHVSHAVTVTTSRVTSWHPILLPWTSP